MHIREKIQNLIEKVLDKQGMPKGLVVINLDHPADSKFGDYSTNIAMLLAKSLGTVAKDPYVLAQKIADEINKEISGIQNSPIERAEVAKPGFINFFLTRKFFVESVAEVLQKTAWYGKNTKLWNKKIIIEHTNLNPYKPVHIGHLVNNAIGESLSRIYEFHDAKLTRASYGGDIGLHVAKALWGIMQSENELPQNASLKEIVGFIGQAYADGSEAYDTDGRAKEDIQVINKKVYDRSDETINKIYDWGKKASIDYFDEVSQKLGSHFDLHLFESEVATDGMILVNAGLERGIFEKSDGAIIFPGEKYGLHNRVFITSQGLPTYEAKELGLTKKKFELHDFNYSIIVTAAEQNDYFKVIIKTLEQLYPEIASRTKHVSHGLMRLTTGKMSSRKGNVVTAESLMDDLAADVTSKIKEGYTEEERRVIADKVSVAAIKYSILRQSVGKDIIFDPGKSLSFEGDSGPYLQYTFVRAKSVLAKAAEEGIEAESRLTLDIELADFEKNLYKFPEIVERAGLDLAPNYIATYLTELASSFNSYYATNKIVDKNDKHSAHKVALTEAAAWVLRNGLYLLGIDAPEKM